MLAIDSRSIGPVSDAPDHDKLFLPNNAIWPPTPKRIRVRHTPHDNVHPPPSLFMKIHWVMRSPLWFRNLRKIVSTRETCEDLFSCFINFFPFLRALRSLFFLISFHGVDRALGLSFFFFFAPPTSFVLPFEHSLAVCIFIRLFRIYLEKMVFPVFDFAISLGFLRSVKCHLSKRYTSY